MSHNVNDLLEAVPGSGSDFEAHGYYEYVSSSIGIGRTPDEERRNRANARSLRIDGLPGAPKNKDLLGVYMPVKSGTVIEHESLGSVKKVPSTGGQHYMLIGYVDRANDNPNDRFTPNHDIDFYSEEDFERSGCHREVEDDVRRNAVDDARWAVLGGKQGETDDYFRSVIQVDREELRAHARHYTPADTQAQTPAVSDNEYN